MINRRLVATGLLLINNSASAAVVDDLGNCEFRLSGEIQSGDAEVLLTAMLGCNFKTLYLNSPGGSLSEAMQIMIGLERTTTIIESGAACLSACALIFMSGRNCSGSPWFCYPTRRMHRDSQLGFHAPSLSDGTISTRPVDFSEAFNTTVSVLGRVHDIISEINGEVRQTGYSGYAVHPELVAIIFSTPPSEMFLIETNDQFYHFDIYLTSDEWVFLPDLSDAQLAHMCNSLIWANARGWSYTGDGRVIGAPYDVEHDAFELVITRERNLSSGVSAKGQDREYFVQVSDLNIGVFLNGWCVVRSETQWPGNYSVSFNGDLGFHSLTLEDVLIAGNAMQSTRYRFQSSMHYSMSAPFGTPVRSNP
jgi:hypothetical protein